MSPARSRGELRGAVRRPHILFNTPPRGGAPCIAGHGASLSPARSTQWSPAATHQLRPATEVWGPRPGRRTSPAHLSIRTKVTHLHALTFCWTLTHSILVLENPNNIWVRMKRGHICGVWMLLQLWRGIASQDYTIQVSSSVSVQEGLCVSIPCSFTAGGRNTFSNSFGYWYRMSPPSGYIVATNDKSSVVQKTNFHLTGNPDTGDCTLTITDAGKEDEGEYFFRFEESKNSALKWNYKDILTTITVTDLTEEPVISNLGTVTAGIEKTVTCSPPGNCSETSLVFQWKKSDVPGIWKNSPTITFTPSLYDHLKTITCEMKNSKGKTTRKTIRLDVCYLAKEPIISDLGTLTAGIEKTVICSPSGNCSRSSLVIQWKKSDVPGIWKNSPNVTFTPSLDDHQKTITCEMTNSKGTTTQKTIHLDVCYVIEEPVISNFGTLTAGINKTVTCAASGNCSVTSLVIQWKKSDVPGIWKNSPTVTFTPSLDDHQKTITCEMKNSKGKTIQKTIVLEVYMPLLEDPKFIAGLITGGVIIVSAILLGIVFHVRRNKKNKPSDSSALTRDPPARKKVEEGVLTRDPPARKKVEEGNLTRDPPARMKVEEGVLTRNPPVRMKVEEDFYINSLEFRPRDDSCFAMKAMDETEENIYANV